MCSFREIRAPGRDLLGEFVLPVATRSSTDWQRDLIMGDLDALCEPYATRKEYGNCPKDSKTTSHEARRENLRDDGA